MNIFFMKKNILNMADEENVSCRKILMKNKKYLKFFIIFFIFSKNETIYI